MSGSGSPLPPPWRAPAVEETYSGLTCTASPGHASHLPLISDQGLRQRTASNCGMVFPPKPGTCLDYLLARDFVDSPSCQHPSGFIFSCGQCSFSLLMSALCYPLFALIRTFDYCLLRLDSGPHSRPSVQKPVVFSP